MSKWVVDLKTHTILNMDDCVIFDDSKLDYITSEEEFMDYAESCGQDLSEVLARHEEEKVVSIVWSPEDVQMLVKQLSYDEASEALQKVSKTLHDRSIEMGWEVLEIALSMEGYETE